MTYYNEFDPFAAEWLQNLSDAGAINPGQVDRRSIVSVDPQDIPQGSQAHFFAGIGVWSLALRMAGMPDNAFVWTGSCPCQPFSVAGKQKGEKDERHLWPEWLRLIAVHRPPVLFGEQVASPAGRNWLATVRTDLEALGYEVGAADLCAAGVGAPHIRQRLFFGARLANSKRPRLEGHPGHVDNGDEPRRLDKGSPRSTAEGSSSSRMEDPAGERLGGERLLVRPGKQREEAPEAAGRSQVGGMVGVYEWRIKDVSRRPATFWSDVDFLLCREPTSMAVGRPVEPGTFPMAHGSPGRVGKLRAYGNAIVPQVAAEFIKAFMEA